MAKLLSSRLVVIILMIGAVIGFIFLSPLLRAPGQLKVTLDPNSQVKKDIVVYVSDDKFTKPHSLPLTLNLRPKIYQLYITAPSGQPNRLTVTIKSNETTTTIVKLQPVVELGQTEITPSAEEFSTNPYLLLLPHREKNFEVAGSFDRDDAGAIIVKQLTIFPLNNSGQTGINQANGWIKAQKILATIPVVVTAP